MWKSDVFAKCLQNNTQKHTELAWRVSLNSSSSPFIEVRLFLDGTWDIFHSKQELLMTKQIKFLLWGEKFDWQMCRLIKLTKNQMNLNQNIKDIFKVLGCEVSRHLCASKSELYSQFKLRAFILVFSLHTLLSPLCCNTVSNGSITTSQSICFKTEFIQLENLWLALFKSFFSERPNCFWFIHKPDFKCMYSILCLVSLTIVKGAALWKCGFDRTPLNHPLFISKYSSLKVYNMSGATGLNPSEKLWSFWLHRLNPL